MEFRTECCHHGVFGYTNTETQIPTCSNCGATWPLPFEEDPDTQNLSNVSNTTFLGDFQIKIVAESYSPDEFQIFISNSKSELYFVAGSDCIYSNEISLQFSSESAISGSDSLQSFELKNEFKFLSALFSFELEPDKNLLKLFIRHNTNAINYSHLDNPYTNSERLLIEKIPFSKNK